MIRFEHIKIHQLNHENRIIMRPDCTMNNIIIVHTRHSTSTSTNILAFLPIEACFYGVEAPLCRPVHGPRGGPCHVVGGGEGVSPVADRPRSDELVETFIVYPRPPFVANLELTFRKSLLKIHVYGHYFYIHACT